MRTISLETVVGLEPLQTPSRMMTQSNLMPFNKVLMVIKTQFLTRTFAKISSELSLLLVSQQQQVLWLLHSSFDTPGLLQLTLPGLISTGSMLLN